MGALLAVQVRTWEPTRASIRFRLRTTAEEQLGKQHEQIQDLQKRLTKYENAASNEKALLKVMNDELQAYKLTLGVTKVTGPGILLLLDDSSLGRGKIESKFLAEISLVHSSDLVEVANELWAAGAEAVAIGGQRITANTAIRCAGPVVQVNGVAVPSPYQILAIGDPEVLTSALNMRGGVLDMMKSYGYQVKLVQKTEIVLPPVALQPKFKLAKLVIEKAVEGAGSPR